MDHWSFWVDRGGTFTDIIACSPKGELESFKLLSDDPDHYQDAVSHGIQTFLDNHNASNEKIIVKMGATVATNALLEKKGAQTLLLLTEGFKDLLLIRSQHRKHLFKQHIEPNKPLYAEVATLKERLNADGEVLKSLDLQRAKAILKKAYDLGIRSVAVSLLHAIENPAHELSVGEIAREIGFTTVRLSHQVNPEPKWLARTDTTLIDSYLSPPLFNYIERLQHQLIDNTGEQGLYFMQSNGELVQPKNFSGKDAVLSGPAGGIVAMAKTANQAKFEKVIGFDMGGTSTDVSLYDGEFEITQESEVAGSFLRVPMLAVHTVAAGGGSALTFDGERFKVGPESVGSDPGPVAYGRGSQLAVTDINVLLGKIHPDFFPKIFGHDGKQPLDAKACRAAFEKLTKKVNQTTGQNYSVEALANEYLAVAINAMANAVKTISTQRGVELHDFALNAFGGAGGQHACLVAEQLGISRVLVHQQSSLLSAYGMGCGDLGYETQTVFTQTFNEKICSEIQFEADQQWDNHRQRIQPSTNDNVNRDIELWLHYENSDRAIKVSYCGFEGIVREFTKKHQQAFGFTLNDTSIVIRSAVYKTRIEQPLIESKKNINTSKKSVAHPVYFIDKKMNTPFVELNALVIDDKVHGPAILYDQNTTLVVEPGWIAQRKSAETIVLNQVSSPKRIAKNDKQLTPTRLEIFNNLFMHIAEQMGAVLQNTAQSVNIKERLDFSCAVFDQTGNLIANAPHMPVHLGSMSDSVKHIISNNKDIGDGDSFMLNSPYHGGTHLPDITVVSPVFVDDQIRFWVASRGHHADIGGITPGSMPASSQHIDQEGVLIDNFKLVAQYELQRKELEQLLLSGDYPARNIKQNIADLQAQVAANQRGISELIKACNQYGSGTVTAYMNYVQDNAESAIRKVIEPLSPGEFSVSMDNGATIHVAISKPNKHALHFDFSQSSEQRSSNFNAPKSVARAAILYLLRSLVVEDIPLNEGCMRPVTLSIPEGSMLNPRHPAAVVAGNVETSQAVTDCLFGALQLQAGAQGTMNNLTFGDATHQYYETIAGGSGAGSYFDGSDAVQTHMTNSRITDVEILERHFPVRLETFAIRKNSGGIGQYCGGNGVIRRFYFSQPMSANLLTGNRTHQPFGMAGGAAGKPGINRLIQADGTARELGYACHIDINTGDRLEIETPGGGGYGKVEKS